MAVKFADVAPDATVTDAGTVNAAALLDNVTAMPPVTAACDSVTVHADVPLEFRLVGLQDSWLTVVDASSEIDAVLELPLYEAVTTAVCVAVNVPAVAVKFADVAPDATVTDAGTVNAVSLLDSVTAAPPVPAACVRVTVHVEVPPVPRLAGLQDTWLTAVAARSDTYAVCELPFKVPVIPAVRLLGIVPAVALNVVEVVPAGTVTDAGTGSSPVVLERVTTAPPADAGWFSETVQVDELPPLNEVGLQVSPLNVGNGTVTLPPVPVTDIGLPAAAAPIRFVRPSVLLTATVVIVTVIVATTPFCINVSFMPASRHV